MPIASWLRGSAFDRKANRQRMSKPRKSNSLRLYRKLVKTLDQSVEAWCDLSQVSAECLAEAKADILMATIGALFAVYLRDFQVLPALCLFGISVV